MEDFQHGGLKLVEDRGVYQHLWKRTGEITFFNPKPLTFRRHKDI